MKRERGHGGGPSVAQAPESSPPVPGRMTRAQALVAPAQAGPAAQPAAAVRSPDMTPGPSVGIAALFGVPGAAGNARSIVSPDDTATTQQVTATIPMPAGAEGTRPAPGVQAGAEAGKSTAIADLTGEPIVSSLDTVAPTLTFSGSISQGGTVGAGDFGTTNSTPSLKDIAITQASGAFTVTATFSLVTQWDTVKTTGPGGQVDLPDENAGALTAANYTTAVSDLTPNMSDLGGRPPRTQFWAKDLTERHEKVHAADHQRTGREGMAEAIKWLKTQTASTEADVRTLLTTARDKIVAYIVAHGAGNTGEIHAYSDGAASYKSRADKIKAKGDKKGYP